MNNNEPVAWIAVGDNTNVFFDLDCALAIDDNPTPLYTHPHSEESVKAKTLTDEEIMKCVKQFTYARYYEDFFKFAKKILKKASKK